MLDEVARRRIFASVTDAGRLAELYVRSDQLAGLSGDDRPEAQLMQALTSNSPPQRVQVVGPAGAGKSSMVLRVLGDLASMPALDRPREALIVNVGDDPAQLQSPVAFMRTVVKLVERQKFRFANVDPELLREASADERSTTEPQVDHRATLDAKVVSYSVGLKEAFTVEKFGENPARARQDFEESWPPWPRSTAPCS